MKRIWKYLLIEIGLFVLLTGFIILLLMCIDVIKVNGFEVVSQLFNPQNETYKKYGVIVIFTTCFAVIVYLMLFALAKALYLHQKILYYSNTCFFALATSSAVVSILLLTINF